MFNARIKGTGSYVPENIVTNDMISAFVDTNDEWIKSRTGISNRRITTNEGCADLAYKAAQRALEDAGVEAEDLDMIILATISPDNFSPSTACTVQARLGAKNATSFDITAACSGFVYGLNIANQFIRTGTKNKVLVIGVEVLSKLLNWEDRNTCILFGDGAGAVVLEATEEEGIINIYTGSDGDLDGNLLIPAVDTRNPFVKDIENRESYIDMNGKEIFMFATRIIRKCIKNVLKDTDVEKEELKYIVPHQANSRIIEHVSNKAKIDFEKFYLNLNDYGNTSSASIPIALDEMNRKNLLKRGDKLLMVGFGGGLTWGSALLSW